MKLLRLIELRVSGKKTLDRAHQTWYSCILASGDKDRRSHIILLIRATLIYIRHLLKALANRKCSMIGTNREQFLEVGMLVLYTRKHISIQSLLGRLLYR